MLLLESVGRNTANDVVSKEQNLNETEKCVQTRKKVRSIILDIHHTYKRSDDFPHQDLHLGGRRKR